MAHILSRHTVPPRSRALDDPLSYLATASHAYRPVVVLGVPVGGAELDLRLCTREIAERLCVVTQTNLTRNTGVYAESVATPDERHARSAV